ncbi:13577_t:CDS:2, partial [Racocetra fulgida]
MASTTIETEEYDTLLKRILEPEDESIGRNFSITTNGSSVGSLPPELEAAMEDETQAEQYLNKLKIKVETWQTTGLTGAMKRALDLLNENGMTDGTGLEEDEDTDGSNDEPSTPITEVQDLHSQPKIAEGSISRLGKITLTIITLNKQKSKLIYSYIHSIKISVNGVSSLVDIEKCFEGLQIPELDLTTTPESKIQATLNELYKLQEDLQIHLQGGPLADPSTLGTQRRKKVSDLLERVMKEAALYEEFVNRASHLSLERILNESDVSSEEEFQDSETLDTESGIHCFEDSFSDISRRSTTTTSTAPLSPRSLKPIDPHLTRLRTMSNASAPSMRSRASSRRSRSSSPSVLDQGY